MQKSFVQTISVNVATNPCESQDITFAGDAALGTIIKQVNKNEGLQ